MSIAFHGFGHAFDADRIPDFEGTQFPGEAPACGAIEVHNVVRNFRHQARGVEAGLAKAGPQHAIGFVAAFAIKCWREQGAEAFARVFDGFACFDGRKFRFEARAIIHFLPVEREDFRVGAFFYFFVEAAAGFVSQPAAF